MLVTLLVIDDFMPVQDANGVSFCLAFNNQGKHPILVAQPTRLFRCFKFRLVDSRYAIPWWTTGENFLHGNQRTGKIKSVFIIKNGNQVIHEEKPEGKVVNFSFVDRNWQEADESSYYVRVVQEDLHYAWSSPIWVRSGSD